MHFKYLEGAGASLVNGTTSFDRTNYMEDLPSNQLELALWLESDRMGFLLEKLDQKMLSNQQDVVRNERRQSIENAPYGLAEEEVYHQLFPQGHPYYAAVIGSHADVQAAQLSDVQDFFKKYYAPNNATLAVVGDIDIEKTKGLIEKYFGTIPTGPAVDPVNVQTPPITAEKRVNLTDQVELPRTYMAWVTSPYFSPGDAEADITARLLGGGKASRMYKSLVYDKKIAQDVSAQQQSASLGSVFQITVTAKPGHTTDELEAAVNHELDSLATNGPTEEELAAVKNAIYTNIITSLENVGGFAGVADRLQTYNHFVGTPDYLNKDLARYSAVTTDAIKQFARTSSPRTSDWSWRWSRGRRCFRLRRLPRRRLKWPPALRSSRRSRGGKRCPSPARCRRRRCRARPSSSFRNGLGVYLVENHALPVVSAELVVRCGSSADPMDRPGLAGFTVSMIDEGTSKRDALTIRARSRGARSVLRLGHRARRQHAVHPLAQAELREDARYPLRDGALAELPGEGSGAGAQRPAHVAPSGQGLAVPHRGHGDVDRSLRVGQSLRSHVDRHRTRPQVGHSGRHRQALPSGVLTQERGAGAGR
jgi:zinc protease